MSRTKMVARGTTRMVAYCRCGNTAKVEGDAPELVEEAIGLFWSLHQGDGHGGTDAATARRARQRKSREEWG